MTFTPTFVEALEITMDMTLNYGISFVRRAAAAAALSIAAIGAISISGGCTQQEMEVRRQARQAQLSRSEDMQIVEAVRDSGVRAAIVAEHTIYAYHFVSNSDELNELGQRDLSVLASHYRAHASGGMLNVYRTGTSEALYSARVKVVVAALKAQGVNTDQLHVSDGPAGDGKTMSQDVLRDVRAMHADSKPFNGSSQSTMQQESSPSQGSGDSQANQNNYGGQK